MAEEENITALVDAFGAAWNTHDEEAIMDWFTEGAVVSMSPSPSGQPDTYHGKEEISGWMRQTLPGFHVETKRHGELGDTVTSDLTIATNSSSSTFWLLRTRRLRFLPTWQRRLTARRGTQP